MALHEVGGSPLLFGGVGFGGEFRSIEGAAVGFAGVEPTGDVSRFQSFVATGDEQERENQQPGLGGLHGQYFIG